jgi:hypothetical protein
MDGMVKYLENIIAKKNYSRDMYSQGDADADTPAFFAMTLGRMNRPQFSLMQDLWRSKDRLTPFGLSFLAAALKESGDRTIPLSDVLAEIRKTAIETADSATFPGSPRGNWSFDTPTRTNAAALMAYAFGDPQNPLTAKFLRGLMGKRRDGLWGTTQGNVFGIMAIYHLTSGSALTGRSAPSFTVSIDGKTYSTSAFSSLSSSKAWVFTVNEAELPPARTDPRTQGIQNRNISGFRLCAFCWIIPYMAVPFPAHPPSQCSLPVYCTGSHVLLPARYGRFSMRSGWNSSWAKILFWKSTLTVFLPLPAVPALRRRHSNISVILRQHWTLRKQRFLPG